jgi:uncharacterized protein DUF6603
VAGFPDNLLEAIALAFQPMMDGLADPNELSALVAEFGWTFDPASAGGANSFQQALGNIASDIQTVLNDVQSQPANLIQDVPKLVSDLLQTIPQASGTVAPFDLPQFWTGTNNGPGFLEDLFAYLISTYVQNSVPMGYGLLRLIGVFDEVQTSDVPASGTFPGRRGYLQRLFNPQKIVSAVANPRGVAADIYNWGNPGGRPFDADRFFQSVAAIFGAVDVASGVVSASDSLYDLYYDRVPTSPPSLSQMSILPFSYVAAGSVVAGNFKLSLNALPVPQANTRTGYPTGMALFPLVTGQIGQQIEVTANVAISIKGSFATVPVLIEIRPTGVAITPLPTTSSLTTLNTDARVDATAEPGSAWTLIGDPDASNLQLSGIHFSIDANGAVSDLTTKVEIGLDKLALNIDFGGADGFLSTFFGSGSQAIGGSLTVSWSNKTGFRFGGVGALKETLPVHQSILNIVTLDSVAISLDPMDSAVALTVSVSGGLTLGPIDAAVDEVGFLINVDTKPKPDAKNNTGLFAASLGFKPPKGLGIAIDAGAVAGGGFISFDETKGEYAGFLDIAIAEIIQVKFIGILDTKLPDGKPGYSLLFIIFMELPPIQLGFGFTLNGVGGVAGVNRTMSDDGLQAGLRNHTLDYIINPPQTIVDAPKVINAVNGFFPLAQGRYVFGPILSVGWETFVQLTVGVLVEVPDPIKAAILGIIDVFLPTIEEPEVALVKIHIDVLGLWDLGAKKLSIDGSMYDSRLLQYALAGDFSFRSAWGPNPSSLFSLGGFNPNFNTTGINVPQLRRLSISIGNGDNPSITASAYLALTSNTIQFGANIEARASAGDFSVHGYIGFDLLVVIQRPTVSFIFDFSANFDVAYKGNSLAGLNVSGVLSGTTPWNFQGSVSFNILCFTVSASVNLTWGETIAPAIPQIAVLPDLLPPFQDLQNWNAVLPDGATQAATLRTTNADKKTIVVHPMGKLTVREKVVPLDLTITQYKGGTPSDGNYFSVGEILIDGAPVSKSPYPDYFASAQFLNLSDADKLSRSSFDSYHAGAQIATSTSCAGAESTRNVVYDEYYLDDRINPLRPSTPYRMPAGVFQSLSHQSAGFLSPLKNTGLNKYKVGPSTPAAVVKDTTYVVASTEDLSLRSDIVPATGTSYYQARSALNAHLSKNPQDAGTLQIMAAHEVPQ